MADQIHLPFRALDANGNAVSGAKAYFYQSNTTTPVTVYTTEALSVAHPSPLVADSGGKFAQAFYSGSPELRVRIFDAADNELWDIDPAITVGTSTGAATISFAPITGNAATNVQTAIANNTASVLDLTERGDNTVRPVLTGGSSNAYTLTAENTITAYAENQGFQIIANHTNSGAATINVDSLGAKDVQKYDTAGSPTALAAGDLVQGGVYDLVYDGTRFLVAGPVQATETIPGIGELATTAERLAGTAGKLIDAAQHKAGIDALPIKAWVNFDGVGGATIRASFNVSGIVRNAAGDYRISFTTAMPDTNYAVIVSTGGFNGTSVGRQGNSKSDQTTGPINKTTTYFEVLTGATATGGLADQADINVMVLR